MATLPSIDWSKALLAGVFFGLQLLFDLPSISVSMRLTKKLATLAMLLMSWPFFDAALREPRGRLRRLLIGRLREEQGDVDVDAVFEKLANRGDAFRVRRNFDHDSSGG